MLPRHDAPPPESHPYLPQMAHGSWEGEENQFSERFPILSMVEPFTTSDASDDPISSFSLQQHEGAVDGKVLVAHKNGGTGENIAPHKGKSWNFIWEFCMWLYVLRDSFGVPFLAVVVIVYGISQGFAGTIKSLATNYYWKDVQKLQPSSTQAFQALASMPWNIKPIYGIISDTFPIAGYQRWPYLALCGVLGALFFWALALFTKPSPWIATLLMAGVALCTAFPDVVTDAAVAQQSRSAPELTSDLQSLSWGSSAVGGLIGSSISGSTLHSLGPRGSYLLISMAPLMLLVAAWAFPENRLPKGLRHMQIGALFHTIQVFGRTLWDPRIWKPALYIYLSQGALCPDISEAMFFWLTDPVVGPGFSEQFMGLVNAVGYLAMVFGVAIYNRWFSLHTFRTMFLWPQVAACAIGLLDIVLVTRTNLILKIPDHAFVLGDEALSDVIRRLQLMPMLVLSARICPPGVEGTVFAFLMSVSNFGTTCGTWFGAVLLKWLLIQRENYDKLWLAVLIRSLMRLAPLLFLFLLPNGTVNTFVSPQSDGIGNADVEGKGSQMTESL